MNPQNLHSSTSVPRSYAGEETLRFLARLPAPDGLADRLHAALREGELSAGEEPGRFGRFVARLNFQIESRIGALRLKFDPEKPWVRPLAAAAIVLVVVGGGWGVYAAGRMGQRPAAAAMPAHMPAASGGFSSAGAVRTPVTLSSPAAAQPESAQPNPVKKPAANGKPSAPAVPAKPSLSLVPVQ
jgi:hypothetical protein